MKFETLNRKLRYTLIPLAVSALSPLAAHAQSWQLVWSDEFHGSISPDWVFETGNNGGWGNNELEYYTSANATVQNDALVITAKKQEMSGYHYTSARMTTQNKRNFQYGRMEARIKLPAVQGTWPAFWMLGSNIPQVGWPASGELDIMEQIDTGNTVYGTAHWMAANGTQADYGLNMVTTVTDWHVYAIEWSPTTLRWFVDGTQYCVMDITNGVGNTYAFQNSFFLLLNMAVGGNWPGFTIDDAHLPASMYVDYVRVYTSGSGGGGGGGGGGNLSPDLPNGTYTITASNSSKCVDVAASGTADGTNIQQYTCNGTKAQVFTVTNAGNGWYKFINPNSGKAMDVSGNSTADGANVQIWTDNGTGAQRFQNKRVNGNYFNIINQTSGKCVDVQNGYTYDGANIQQWTCVGTPQQFYQFKPTSVSGGGSKLAMGRYTLVSQNSGKCLDVDSASTADGANIQQYTCNGTGAQAFDLMVEGGYYHVINANSGKGMDVAGFGTADGTNIQQWTVANSDNQRFAFVSKGNGQYAIVEKQSGKCVDVAGQSTADRANVQLWTCNGQANQNWSLKPSTY